MHLIDGLRGPLHQEGVSMSRKYLGFLYMFLSAFCFSLMGILSKLIFKFGISSLDLIVMQNIIQVLVLGLYHAFRKFKDLKLGIKDLKIISVQGLLGSVPVLIFYYVAIQRLNASIACLLLFTNPIFITLYYIVIEKQKAGTFKVIAVAATFVGSIMVLNITPQNIGALDMIGIAAGFLSSISYAFYNVYAEKKLGSYSPGAILFYCSLVVVIFVSIINPGFYTRGYITNIELMGYVSILAVAASILPVVFLYSGISILGAQIASVVATAEIPFTLLLSSIVLSEKLTLIQIIGSIMIMTAIVLLNREGDSGIDEIKRAG